MLRSAIELTYDYIHTAMAPPAAIEVLAESDTSTFTVPDRLTIQNVAKRRVASGKLIAGVAAVADVDAFKGRTAHLHKPKAKRFDCKWSPPTRTEFALSFHW